ncbi:30S ribosomal protein S14 [Candidatus Woesearchaeota archaeon]|nr:30S ribosomal protein S14 [Candidatus Woesearchaeota archaeon]
MKKYLKHNKPKERTTGMTTRRCVRCGRYGGRVTKYGLDYCRCCFREIATKIGFKKYS